MVKSLIWYFMSEVVKAMQFEMQIPRFVEIIEPLFYVKT